MPLPDPYTPELATRICERLARGESLRSICRDEQMPGRTTVAKWISDDHEGFAGQYARARDVGIDMLAEEAIEISDDGSNDWMLSNDPNNPGYRLNGEHSSRSRLRVDTRKWYTAKLAPKRYGDRIAHEHTGADGGPIKSEAVVNPSHRADLIADIAARLGGLAGAAEPGVAPTSGTAT